ncbi:MAG: hypothetical protein U5R49_07130 [Deltaproteobacteria bacterium]|nr:hypothetical protein [Deltaproteobacteria bacterium]
MTHMKLQPFVDVYTTLPAGAQAKLYAEASQLKAALDRAIAAVLQPTIARSADAFIMRDEKIPLYGVGETPQAAMDDYRSVIVEYYESLDADADHLGAALREQLATLSKVFAMLETSP